jgi:formate hydrogenlyase subunit 6/NADH:ubiquinone oxidoreductase subunit I
MVLKIFTSEREKVMKPTIIDKKCAAHKSMCKALKACPVFAISYIEVDEPIDREVDCANAPNYNGGCGCNSDCGENINNCGGFPYGRIIINDDKCIICGVCIKECCGNAIEMID